MILKNERIGIEKKFFDLVCLALEKEKLALYDLEYLPGQGVLRIYIQNKETQTALLDDCVYVDRILTPYIEKEDWIPDTLTLEVSSPGIFRSLRTLEHFQSVLEQMITVVVSKKWEERVKEIPKAYQGQKKFRGVLKKVENEGVMLELPLGEFNILFEEMKKAYLDPDLKDGHKLNS